MIPALHPDSVAQLPTEAVKALVQDQTIDIVTLGRKSGLPRTTEIWFTRIEDRIVICGTPGAGGDGGIRYNPRDWLANLKAHPKFWFCLKESLEFCLPALAMEITDARARREIFSHPATRWYQQQVSDLEALHSRGPLVEVFFLADASC